MTLNAIQLAKLAYNAYGENRHWKTFDDRPMPSWEKLTGTHSDRMDCGGARRTKGCLIPDNPDRG